VDEECLDVDSRKFSKICRHITDNMPLLVLVTGKILFKCDWLQTFLDNVDMLPK
jgi:hypothetical protein